MAGMNVETLRPDDQLILEFYPGRVLFGRTLSARFGELCFSQGQCFVRAMYEVSLRLAETCRFFPTQPKGWRGGAGYEASSGTEEIGACDQGREQRVTEPIRVWRRRICFPLDGARRHGIVHRGPPKRRELFGL